jgi:hypothetical protein
MIVTAVVASRWKSPALVAKYLHADMQQLAGMRHACVLPLMLLLAAG